MCLIVDANVFSSVFDVSAKEHKKFVPVYNWLMTGYGGRLIYGGSKYKREIDLRSSHYRRLLGEIERKGRLLPMKDEAVDVMAAAIKEKVGDVPDFDDEHIVALVAISKCCVVCTADKRSFPYLKRRDLYPKGVKPPKIYQTARNAKLCCESHVADVCR